MRSARKLSALLALVGVLALSYVAGATVMFFRLPSAAHLEKALLTAHDWPGLGSVSSPKFRAVAPSASAKSSLAELPQYALQGYTLVAVASMERASTNAVLLDMDGEEVHKWSLPYHKFWPDPPDYRDVPLGTPRCFFGCHLYPNGDLLVTFHGCSLQSGCGLVKIDKNSDIVWSYKAPVHHDVEVADDGTIYVLQHEWRDELPDGLNGISKEWLEDYLVLLSAGGKPLREPIALLKGLLDSPFRSLLAPFEAAVRPQTAIADITAPRVTSLEFKLSDPLHTNCVRILRGPLADKFPGFKPGHVLLSFRNLSLLAMMDPATGRIEWAARGPWQAQHDPHFLDNGRLLIFDNLGSPGGARVFEWDPQTGAVPWVFSGPRNEQFFCNQRGMCQRLPNDNTLVVNSEGSKLWEITPDKEMAWSCSVDGTVQSARRYAPEELPFLNGQPAKSTKGSELNGT